MANKDELIIVNHLLQIGCCRRCALRMMCRHLNFLEPEKFTSQAIQLKEDNGSEAKKMKSNPCIVCLNILEDSMISEMVSAIPLDEISKHDSPTYVCFLSAPAAVLIREHSLKCYLKEKYPKFYTDLKTIRQLNKVWKLCMSQVLDGHLQKKLDDNAPLSITFHLEYDQDKEETSVMTKLDSVKFNQRLKHARKFQGEIFSKNAIDESLARLDYSRLKKYIDLPPSVPTAGVICKSVEINSEPIYIAGRYCKYSRHLGQTPWVHEETNITDCVQDFIFRGVEKILGYNKEALTFSASGREDYDVRCLGKGRPFYIQINNPKITKIPFEKFRELENEINTYKEVSVRDMQLVNKCDLKEIKTGEQFKNKHYTALCITDASDIQKAVDRINSYGSFKIEQKTPLRVLHRRTLDTREKTIYEMKAKVVEGKSNWFILDVLTQAGTYVKELVHGDLERTKPNIRDIIEADADILALDVNSINLDWPPEIKYNACEETKLPTVKISSDKENCDLETSSKVEETPVTC